jgi:hypothetical protein
MTVRPASMESPDRIPTPPVPVGDGHAPVWTRMRRQSNLASTQPVVKPSTTVNPYGFVGDRRGREGPGDEKRGSSKKARR